MLGEPVVPNERKDLRLVGEVEERRTEHLGAIGYPPSERANPARYRRGDAHDRVDAAGAQHGVEEVPRRQPIIAFRLEEVRSEYREWLPRPDDNSARRQC